MRGGRGVVGDAQRLPLRSAAADAPAVRVEWPIVLERVRATVAAEIEAEGTFEMATESAVFVCRA